MILNPIISIWLMLPLTILLITYIIFKNKKINKKSLMRISLIIILFIINLRPMIKTNDANSQSENLNILFVIDTTLSMNAEDVTESKTRLEQVKKDCNYIIEQFPSATYALVTFNNAKIPSKINVPFTTDKTMLKNSLDIIETINDSYANGSSLNTPQENMTKMLKNIKKKNNNSNIVFFISDGEITDDSKLKSYEDIKQYVDNGAVLGYGTEKGGYMKYIDYNDEEVYVTYYDSNHKEKKGISVIDEKNLKTIAKDIGIEYIHMDKQSNIDKTLKNISKTTTSKLTETKIEAYDDIYYIFVIPLLIILFLIYKEYKEEYTI